MRRFVIAIVLLSALVASAPSASAAPRISSVELPPVLTTRSFGCPILAPYYGVRLSFNASSSGTMRALVYGPRPESPTRDSWRAVSFAFRSGANVVDLSPILGFRQTFSQLRWSITFIATRGPLEIGSIFTRSAVVRCDAPNE